MTAPNLDVLLALLAAVVLVTLVTAPLGLRFMCRAFGFGLALLALEVLLISAAPGVGAWVTEVVR